MCLGSYAAVNEGVWVLVATVGTRCLLWMGCSREPGLERALEMLCSSEASAPYSTRGGLALKSHQKMRLQEGRPLSVPVL